MNIIVIENNPKAISLISSTLRTEFLADVISFAHAAPGIEHLKIYPETDMVIVRNINPSPSNTDEDSASIILNHIYDHKLKAKVIVLGEFEAAGFEYINLQERFKLSGFTSIVRKALGLTLQEFEDLKLGDYLPIDIQNFYVMNQAPCDTYIKISRSSIDQFIKRIHAGDNFDKDDIKKYEIQGVSELFIPKNQKDVFLQAQLKQYLTSITDLSKPEPVLLELRSDAYDINQTLIKNTGITEQMILMSQASIKVMAKSVSQNKKLGTLLKNILSNRGSFAYKHSYLITVFASACITKMEWSEDKQFEVNIERMTYAAFFHDILLTDEKIIKIRNKIELYQTKLNKAEKEVATKHAHQMAELIQEMRFIPTGTQQIIREHHGMKNGIGYAEVYTSNLGAMSIMFIVIEDFVTSLLDIKEKSLTIKDILEDLEKKFTLPSYKKVFEALKKSLTDSF